MKRFLLFFVLFFAIYFVGVQAVALEKGGISIEKYVVNKSSTEDITTNYKKEIDETFVNYLNNSKKHFKNRAKVSFTVTKNGAVRDVSLLQSSGNVKNDDFVLNMVNTSTFPSFPASLGSNSLTFNYYISNPKKPFAIPTLTQAIPSSSISPSFMEKLSIFDPVIAVANFVLNCCFLRYM